MKLTRLHLAYVLGGGILLGCQGGSFHEATQTESTVSEPRVIGDEEAVRVEPLPEPQPKPPKQEPPKPVAPPPPVEKPLPPNAPIFKECNADPTLKMVADLYPLPQNTARLPDFTSMKPVKTICLAQLNITNRDFRSGFPGVEQLFEWFGLVIRFRVNVPADGIYMLNINSDDGSKVYIDGAAQPILNVDGIHPATQQTTSVNLKAGWHDVKVEYFQGPRYAIALELFWQQPNQAQKTYIPSMYLDRPLKP